MRRHLCVRVCVCVCMRFGGGKAHPQRFGYWKKVKLNEAAFSQSSHKRFCDQKMQTKASFSTPTMQQIEKKAATATAARAKNNFH